MLEGDFTGRPVQRDAQDGVQASDEDGHPLGRGHRLGRGFEDATFFGLRRHGEIGGGGDNSYKTTFNRIQIAK